MVSACEVGVVLTLCGDDGLPLAVVEAKRTSKDATVANIRPSYMPIAWRR